MCIAIPPPGPDAHSRFNPGWWQWLSASPMRLFAGAALVQLGAVLFARGTPGAFLLSLAAAPVASLAMGWLLSWLPRGLGQPAVDYVRYAVLFFLQFPAGLLLAWGLPTAAFFPVSAGLVLAFAAWLLLWRHFRWQLQWASHPAPRAAWLVRLLAPAMPTLLGLVFLLFLGHSLGLI